MGNRIRHRLRRLWSAGLLKVGGRAPTWMTRDIQEAAPEDIRNVLDRQAEPAKSSLEALVTDGCCVGRNRETGRLLASGAGCLDERWWVIEKRGTMEECLRYMRGVET